MTVWMINRQQASLLKNQGVLPYVDTKRLRNRRFATRRRLQNASAVKCSFLMRIFAGAPVTPWCRPDWPQPAAPAAWRISRASRYRLPAMPPLRLQWRNLGKLTPAWPGGRMNNRRGMAIWCSRCASRARRWRVTVRLTSAVEQARSRLDISHLLKRRVSD